MENGPLISVVIPCFNQARFLPEALASVQAQTFQDWECIIVNDGSPDGTAIVAREWLKIDSRFRYIEKPNGGLSTARNAGIEHATGEFLHFLDADDYILPGMYKQMLKLFENRPDAAAVYCGFNTVDVHGQLLTACPSPYPESSDLFHDLLQRSVAPCHCVVIRKEAVVDAGHFDPALPSCEDWDLWIRVAASGAPFVPLEGALVCYRQYSNTMSRNYKVMLGSSLSLIRRHAQRHGHCTQCKESSAKGKAFWRRRVLNPPLAEYMHQKEYGRCLYIFSNLALKDPPSAWVCFKILGRLIQENLRMGFCKNCN